MTDLLRVSLEYGKYTVIQTEDGRLRALRYGDEWRDLTGDKLAYALAAEVEKLRNDLEMANFERTGLTRL